MALVNTQIVAIAKELLQIPTHNISRDELLDRLATIAAEDALVDTKNEDILLDYNLLARMTQYLYLQLGNENITEQNLAGVSEKYITDYPEPIVRHFKSYYKLRTL